ncbi:hypothetical protein HNQ64_002433 [Prosthecobacter dejongeii]|uniref:Uncharacterized protein n=1 Tax=Prosthecobacter dejongeii TaxID=48465 RepID=A0A7W7YLK1_9BACT|nr:hypothetical protein [Prosthecobacter dejongeii]
MVMLITVKQRSTRNLPLMLLRLLSLLRIEFANPRKDFRWLSRYFVESFRLTLVKYPE